jgi:hypothetical protein
MDQAETEGLNQMVEALISEIKRSGHGAGFLLELETAAALFAVSQPRRLRCEQQEGLGAVPGDIWLDRNGVRYELQCKHMMNWSVELWVAEATDTIERECADVSPGRYYELRPGIEGTQQDWELLSKWVVDNLDALSDGNEHPFNNANRHVGTIRITPAPGTGLRFGSGWTPGGVQRMDIDFFRQKLGVALAKGRQSLTALPGPKQINCLVIDIDNWLVDKEDVFQALYGQPFITIGPGIPPTERYKWNGLYYTDQQRWAILSAVIWLRLSDCDPLTFRIAVYPHPEHINSVINAFGDIPTFKIIRSNADARGRL